MLITTEEILRLRKIVGDEALQAGVMTIIKAKKNWQQQSMDAKIVHRTFLATIYHHEGTNDEKEEMELDIPGITVESRVQNSLIKSSNALHVCSRCLKSGVPDAEARDILVHNKYRRGDEPMISSMRCRRCGYSWVNTN